MSTPVDWQTLLSGSGDGELDGDRGRMRLFQHIDFVLDWMSQVPDSLEFLGDKVAFQPAQEAAEDCPVSSDIRRVAGTHEEFSVIEGHMERVLSEVELLRTSIEENSEFQSRVANQQDSSTIPAKAHMFTMEQAVTAKSQASTLEQAVAASTRASDVDQVIEAKALVTTVEQAVAANEQASATVQAMAPIEPMAKSRMHCPRQHTRSSMAKQVTRLPVKRDVPATVGVIRRVLLSETSTAAGYPEEKLVPTSCESKPPVVVPSQAQLNLPCPAENEVSRCLPPAAVTPIRRLSLASGSSRGTLLNPSMIRSGSCVAAIPREPSPIGLAMNAPSPMRVIRMVPSCQQQRSVSPVTLPRPSIVAAVAAATTAAAAAAAAASEAAATAWSCQPQAQAMGTGSFSHVPSPPPRPTLQHSACFVGHQQRPQPGSTSPSTLFRCRLESPCPTRRSTAFGPTSSIIRSGSTSPKLYTHNQNPSDRHRPQMPIMHPPTSGNHGYTWQHAEQPLTPPPVSLAARFATLSGSVNVANNMKEQRPERAPVSSVTLPSTGHRSNPELTSLTFPPVFRTVVMSGTEPPLQQQSSFIGGESLGTQAGLQRGRPMAYKLVTGSLPVHHGSQK
eukprot:TRINITY_DN24174_c0_g2_i1.p1 TRINITY_DN24174_c0_g2~~TRINITY_DN24174_c0_g2_i1.p1  ORF type:complete len:617 (-),score=77.08 TRINITY_DN24174_c0_g2_i1:154-2004(-)